jgi:hypothetical protein
LTLSGLGGCGKAPDPPAAGAFLERHWARPLASQGEAPASARAHQISLSPQSCASCHAAQFEDWSRSLHSRAMGPGIMGQLVAMPAGARDEHQDCIRCHAPLKEQADSLSAAIAGNRAVPSLHEQGVVCAACHVRGYEWYGPPRRDGSSPSGDLTALPHNGWKASAAFGDSRFCAACHQFTKDEYALNGKLLENTYEEWKTSRFAREGKSCQSCHMPGRRHLWRGIHDPEMVRGGVEIDATLPEVSGRGVAAALTIRNTGVGHYFPTYVTPRVVAEGYQEDAGGAMIADTLIEQVIARQVPLDLSREIADTRIPPDGEARLDYRAQLSRRAAALVFRVRVEPDAFYTAFYQSVLRDSSAGPGEAQIRVALEQSRKSGYTFYVKRQSLNR